MKTKNSSGSKQRTPRKRKCAGISRAVLDDRNNWSAPRTIDELAAAVAYLGAMEKGSETDPDKLRAATATRSIVQPGGKPSEQTHPVISNATITPKSTTNGRVAVMPAAAPTPSTPQSRALANQLIAALGAVKTRPRLRPATRLRI